LKSIRNAKYTPSFNIERELFDKGYNLIAGIDEAGRGALAGPLAVSMVMYRSSLFGTPLSGDLIKIKDSKLLTPRRRYEARTIIEKISDFVLITLIPHHVIDQLNINGATEYAVKELIRSSPIVPDVIIIDGNFSFNVGVQLIPVLKGDMKSLSVASASIIAKVERDRRMEEFDGDFPGYGFKRNKGYGTREHREALMRVGPSPIHRESYEPLKSMIKNR
jgi:ribonuclease HII